MPYCKFERIQGSTWGWHDFAFSFHWIIIWKIRCILQVLDVNEIKHFRNLAKQQHRQLVEKQKQQTQERSFLSRWNPFSNTPKPEVNKLSQLILDTQYDEKELSAYVDFNRTSYFASWIIFIFRYQLKHADDIVGGFTLELPLLRLRLVEDDGQKSILEVGILNQSWILVWFFWCSNSS